jgi:hypothetical protein
LHWRVEILFAFDIERSIALGTEGGKEYSLIWISEFCLKDDEKGFMALSEVTKLAFVDTYPKTQEQTQLIFCKVYQYF